MISYFGLKRFKEARMTRKNLYQINLKFIGLLLLLFGVYTSLKAQQAKELFITGALPATYNSAELERNLHRWIQFINDYDILEYDQFISDFESTLGVNEFRQLMDKTAIKIISPAISIQIVQLANGSIECRNLFVVIEDGNQQQERELIMVINPSYKIKEIRFAIGFERYQQIIRNSENVVDSQRRRKIISYLEQFRTAYNRKDADYLSQQFSDEALIIVGSRTKKAPNEIQKKRFNLTQDTDTFKRTKLSKFEYIAHLKDNIFKLNANLDVDFKDIKILKHPDYEEIYGVNLYQIWRSSTYSDTGYLYIIIDFENENQPLIHVRAWQKDLFYDESTFDFSFFKIIK